MHTLRRRMLGVVLASQSLQKSSLPASRCKNTTAVSRYDVHVVNAELEKSSTSIVFIFSVLSQKIEVQSFVSSFQPHAHIALKILYVSTFLIYYVKSSAHSEELSRAFAAFAMMGRERLALSCIWCASWFDLET